jgi:hypothetical protein
MKLHCVEARRRQGFLRRPGWQLDSMPRSFRLSVFPPTKGRPEMKRPTTNRLMMMCNYLVIPTQSLEKEV